MKRTKIFVDSDVVISSLISEKGAAHFLLNEQSSKFIISNVSKLELERVVERLGIEQKKLQNLIVKRLKLIELTSGLDRIKSDFKSYISDVDDAHIVAGATKAKAKFLLTYNLKHFKRQEINEDLGIVVLTPSQFLQYLRSVN